MLIKVNFSRDLTSHNLAGVTSVAITTDNKYMISSSDDQSLKLFNLDTKQEIHCFQNAHQCKLDDIIAN